MKKPHIRITVTEQEFEIKNIKISPLNLFLGLKSKKEAVKRLIQELSIDIQEAEIQKKYKKDILSSRNYRLETDNYMIKSRTAINISNKKDYARRGDLEGNDSLLVIIDIMGEEKLRIINVYKCINIG